jgi:hypothetical protein
MSVRIYVGYVLPKEDHVSKNISEKLYPVVFVCVPLLFKAIESILIYAILISILGKLMCSYRGSTYTVP